MIKAATQESMDRMKEYAQEEEKPGADGMTGKLDLGRYLEHYSVRYKIKKAEDATLHVLDHCLFNAEHGRGESAIGQLDNGALFYKCFHLSCSQYTWNDARQAISGSASIRDFIQGGTGESDRERRPRWLLPARF